MNDKDAKGRTAFSISCENGHRGIVQFLLNLESANIDLNAKDVNGWTAFMLACEKGHKDIVKLFLGQPNGKIDLNASNHEGLTAFMVASIFDHKDIVKLLSKNTKIDFANVQQTNILLSDGEGLLDTFEIPSTSSSHQKRKMGDDQSGKGAKRSRTLKYEVQIQDENRDTIAYAWISNTKLFLMICLVTETNNESSLQIHLMSSTRATKSTLSESN